jgi:hypothetical protein
MQFSPAFHRDLIRAWQTSGRSNVLDPPPPYLPGESPMHSPPSRPATPASVKNDPDAVREIVGMRKWLRLTARKHASAKRTENDAAKAAADALALMLKDARKLG